MISNVHDKPSTPNPACSIPETNSSNRKSFPQNELRNKIIAKQFSVIKLANSVTNDLRKITERLAYRALMSGLSSSCKRSLKTSLDPPGVEFVPAGDKLRR